MARNKSEKQIKISVMRTFAKIIIFQIGVDCLGFPLLHKHRLVFKESSSKLKTKF